MAEIHEAHLEDSMKLSLDMVRATVAEIANGMAENATKIMTKPEKKPLDDKAQKIKDILDTHGHHMGCQEPTVRKMMEIVMDVPEGTYDREKQGVWKEIFRTGLVVVPISNPNSHNYALNKPVMLFERIRALRPSGTIGNYLLDDAGNDRPIEEILKRVRIASPEEIKSFCDELEQGFLLRLPTVINEIPELKPAGDVE